MRLAAPLRRIACLAALCAIASSASPAPPKSQLLGSPCTAMPRLDCPQSNCPADAKAFLGAALEAKSGRKFFLDYPCDYKPGEKVTLLLNLHGAGSIGNWQRHYFPAVDYKEKYRLVIATPTALTEQPQRVWTAEADDQYLRDLTDEVINVVGKKNIKAFWLVGHSQGGITSRRIVCSDYFKDKVDGFLSLSGGRIGSPAPAPRAPTGTPADAPPPRPLVPATSPTCGFSHIFDIGQLEAASASVTDTSEWADKYHCGARKRLPDVVDEKAGYVTATDQTRGPAWGRFARPGRAEVYQFRGCKDGRVVADVIREDKGHTEGLEPKITQKILELMLSAKGGKLQKA